MPRYPNDERTFHLAHEEEVECEAQKILSRLPKTLKYHGPQHTLDFVYPESQYLAYEEGFSDGTDSDEDELLIMAAIALFHDTGFSTENYNDNEPIGAWQGQQFAHHSSHNSLRRNSALIYKAILNTNMKRPPQNKYERVIRDADLSVIGLISFMQWNERLRQELITHKDATMHASALSDKLWAKSQLAFLENHVWFTPAANRVYQLQKEKNILAFKREYADVLR